MLCLAFPKLVATHHHTVTTFKANTNSTPSSL